MNMTTVRTRTATLLLLAVGVAAICTAQTPPAVKVIDSVPAPATARGLTMSDGVLFSIDTTLGTLVTLRAGQRRVAGGTKLAIAKAKAVAWDGRSFWCAGEAADKVYQVDPQSGRILKTISVPGPNITSPASIESLAWDGKTLWVGLSAGWSSRISRLDVASGKVTQWFYANSIPAALTADDQHLWMASYNHGKQPSLLARWSIAETGDKTSLTQTFVAKLPGKDPVGLVREGKAFWYADREQRAFQKVQLPTEQ
jgi:DNA-binding beta-propeller fold protein YncE